MNRLFYPKLALQNIQKNAKFYFSYLLASLITVASFYNIIALYQDVGVKQIKGSGFVTSLLQICIYVVGLFALIFLFYTNQFLMKHRQKELGLYHILGMEKRHIAIILLWECLICMAISIFGGLFLGILVSKLLLMALLRLLSFEIYFGFTVLWSVVGCTVLVFAGIFILIFFSNVFHLWRRKGIDLLHGSQMGEREPKANWFLGIIGITLVGIGYYLAITTKSVMNAYSIFFIAVILVIVGTYLLFTSSSILILKWLKANKKFYYQVNHFSVISGMLYRMKQNAVGLANICILSTLVLILFSTSISMYANAENSLKKQYPQQISVSLTEFDSLEQQETEKEKLRTLLQTSLAEHNLTPINLIDREYLVLTCVREGQNFDSIYLNNYENQQTLCVIIVLKQSEYETEYGTALNLMDNSQAVCYMEQTYAENYFILNEIQLNIAGQLTKMPEMGKDMFFSILGDDLEFYEIVVKDEMFDEIYIQQNQMAKAEGDSAHSKIWQYGFDLDEDSETILNYFESLSETKNIFCREQERANFYILYGGVLFIGIFLGTLFLMATVLIIYYKQISEGYEDRQRYLIMQQVGMSRQEIKSSINTQVLGVFFLPLLTAFVHMMAAFPLMSRILPLMGLFDTGLLWCGFLLTFLVFAIGYIIVYLVTANVYYDIVKK